MSRSDQAVKNLNRNLSILARNSRNQLVRTGRTRANIPALYPATVWLKSNGQRLPSPSRGRGQFFSAPLNLVFDASGGNSFSVAYRDFLQDIYDLTQPFLDARFGQPSIGGDVAVKNYNTTMGDREFVTGGYYVPNSPGTPEIRFPVYSDELREVTAINFVHALLLAYIGPNQYGFDAFNEGVVRAVTLDIARTSQFRNGLGLDNDLIEAVLAQTYDVGGFYDWYNQRGLGGNKFIAPNLRDVLLPEAGSVGGIFQLRYKMAGGAWTKALLDKADKLFIRRFNEAFYAQPAIANNASALIALGQTVLNTHYAGDATMEGLPFAEWAKRQFILETRDTRGIKLVVEPIPITSELSGSDFGVFLIQANWFETLAGGNETLLSGTSFPIIWEGNLIFNRIFPSTPDSERMDIAGAYGSVVPNIPNINSGDPYRAAVDVPVQDQIARVYLPVGAIATAGNPTPKNFFGTVSGANLQGEDVLRLVVTVNGGTPITVPVKNNAFGVTIADTDGYSAGARIVVNVIRNRTGTDTTLLTRKVSKGPGELALDLRVESEQDFAPLGGLPKGISLVGFPVDPFASVHGQILGLADNQVLAARYSPAKAKYDLAPDLEPFKIGHGYFVRLDAAQPAFTYAGRNYRNVEATVSLRPGWNLVCSPLTETVPTSRVRVVKTSEFPTAWNEAALDVGAEFFEFVRGPNDTATGAPETGTLVAATQFESGKAYFVRVLAPEGVTLVFRPEQSTGSAPTRAPAVTVPQTGWRLSLTMRFGIKQKAKVILGQSLSATRSFDPLEDSGMPPSFGNGFQLIVEDYEAMYRDIRSMTAGEIYTIHLKGLTKGKNYPIDFAALYGKAPTLSLRDRNGKSLGAIRPGMVYNHFAKGTEDYIQVVVGGTK